MLPADSHVHSEWSWDTGGPQSVAAGRMLATCERAVAIGLHSLFFTEHLDLETKWRATPDDFPPWNSAHIKGGYLTPPLLDVAGYFSALSACRERFPMLTIGSGVEFGQPHRHEGRARELIDLSRFDRIIGSLHTLAIDDDVAEPVTLYGYWSPERVMSEYLAELERMARQQRTATVITHLDYAIRTWPEAQRGPFDPSPFEDDIRGAMTAIAEAGLALEMNTRRLASWMPRWWAECGGELVTFGSDAHVPEALAHGFAEAAELLVECGFVPGASHSQPWERRRT